MKNKFLFSVFVYFIILVLISLGSWQLYRLSWKLDLIKQIENSLKNKPVELSDVEEKNFLRIKTSGKIIFQKQIDHKNSLLSTNLDLDYVETLIRERFLFGKKEETIYIIKKHEK